MTGPAHGRSEGPSNGPEGEGGEGSALDHVVLVLHEPKNIVNVATAIRAMKNMGLSRLRLVGPDEFDAHRITGIAHRAEDVVEGARMFPTLREAVADVRLVLGTSARHRTARRNYGWIRDWAGEVVERGRCREDVAIVFGREDRGLTNDALDLCHGVVVIPSDPAYPSLNLAHAVLIVAYEIFLAAGEAPESLPRGKRFVRRATADEVHQALEALEGGLRAMDFFKGRSPETVMRTFRTLLTRAEPDTQEAGLVRAMGFEIGHYLRRVREHGTPPGESHGPKGTSPDAGGAEAPPE